MDTNAGRWDSEMRWGPLTGRGRSDRLAGPRLGPRRRDGRARSRRGAADAGRRRDDRAALVRARAALLHRLLSRLLVRLPHAGRRRGRSSAVRAAASSLRGNTRNVRRVAPVEAVTRESAARAPQGGATNAAGRAGAHCSQWAVNDTTSARVASKSPRKQTALSSTNTWAAGLRSVTSST